MSGPLFPPELHRVPLFEGQGEARVQLEQQLTDWESLDRYAEKLGKNSRDKLRDTVWVRATGKPTVMMSNADRGWFSGLATRALKAAAVALEGRRLGLPEEAVMNRSEMGDELYLFVKGERR